MTQTIDRAGAPAGPPDEPADRDAPPIPLDTLGGLPLEPWYGPDGLGDRRRARPRRARLLSRSRAGVHRTMYRDKVWTMRQFAGFGSAQDTNERYRFLLGQGQTGLSVAFDMPTLMGIDFGLAARAR